MELKGRGWPLGGSGEGLGQTGGMWSPSGRGDSGEAMLTGVAQGSMLESPDVVLSFPSREFC